MSKPKINFRELPVWKDCPFTLPSDITAHRGFVETGQEAIALVLHDHFFVKGVEMEAMAVGRTLEGTEDWGSLCEELELVARELSRQST